MLRWRGRPLVRPGVWCCLLGSALALVAYFLPYYGPPPGSLWELLRLYWSESNTSSGPIWLSVFLGSFLLLLVGLVVLAFLEVWPRLSSWEMTRWYRRLSILALISSAAITLVGLFSFWFASILGGGFLQVTLGGWLLPVGLIRALLGTIIQPSPAEGQPSERAPD